MKPTKLLITGGAGYIGCVLVPILEAYGYEIRVYDQLVFGDEALRASSIGPSTEIIQGSVCGFDEAVLEDVDAVIHLAGLSNDPTAEFNPAANMKINVDGTMEVAEACCSAGIDRFLFASSCSIYYSLNPYTGLLTETSETSPTAPYSLSKKKAEEGLRALQKQHPSFCPTMLRKGTVFGWSPKMRYDLVVNAFLKDAFTKGRVVVHNGGEIWRPLVSVYDVALAYSKLLQQPEDKIRCESFNIVHKNYRILELAHWIKYALRDYLSLDIFVEYTSNVPPRSYQVDGSKLSDTLGITLHRGIADDACRIWKKFELGECTDFNNPQYYNIKWLELLVKVEQQLEQTGKVLPE